MTVRSLELSSLMTEEDGGFVAKFKKIIEEMVATRGENILFIDEFHTIVGAGSQEGKLSMQEISLNPCLPVAIFNSLVLPP